MFSTRADRKGHLLTVAVITVQLATFALLGMGTGLAAFHGSTSSTHAGTPTSELRAFPLLHASGGKPSHGGGGSTCAATLPAANGVSYTPAQIKAAYGYGSATGAGETIAIIDAYGSSSLQSDLSCFDQAFNLPTPSLTVVAPWGHHGSNNGWGLETSLDVEWAHAMAPSASILLIETPSASLTYLINDAVPYATAHGASVISMSWGSAESSLGCSTEASESTYFANAAASGSILVGASGDNGANDGTSAPTVDYPAADPNVVGAGGTSLTLTGGTYASETTWNDASGATGGGVSKCFSEPSWQSGHSVKVTTLAGGSVPPTGRAVPDVSYNADPATGFWVYDTSGYSGWVQVGGTSAAAPQWAAIFADAIGAGDSNLNGGSVHGLIYNLLGTSSVHDVTTGNNGYYYASAGYDATTGVGTPVESSVVTAL